MSTKKELIVKQVRFWVLMAGQVHGSGVRR